MKKQLKLKNWDYYMFVLYHIVDAATDRVPAFVSAWVHTQDPALVLNYIASYTHDHRMYESCCCAVRKYTYM